jgi:hypothetical protein
VPTIFARPPPEILDYVLMVLIAGNTSQMLSLNSDEEVGLLGHKDPLLNEYLKIPIEDIKSIEAFKLIFDEYKKSEGEKGF